MSMTAEMLHIDHQVRATYSHCYDALLHGKLLFTTPLAQFVNMDETYKYTWLRQAHSAIPLIH